MDLNFWKRQSRPSCLSYSATATSATVAKPVGDGEARLPGIAKNSATTAVPVVVPTFAESVGDPAGIAKNSATSKGEAGSSWSRDGGMTSAAVAAADAESAADARLPEIEKQSATTKPELCETSGNVGPLRSRAGGTNSAAATGRRKACW